VNTSSHALAGFALHAAAIELATTSLPAAQVIAGAPRVGTAVIGTLGSCEVGVWEITPSVTTDVESAEFFIVLSGAATVCFADGSPSLVLTAGSIGHLHAGAATTWHVTETLRKVYLA
jgi:uncharacterized cupin superfamily protein